IGATLKRREGEGRLMAACGWLCGCMFDIWVYSKGGIVFDQRRQLPARDERRRDLPIRSALHIEGGPPKHSKPQGCECSFCKTARNEEAVQPCGRTASCMRRQTVFVSPLRLRLTAQVVIRCGTGADDAGRRQQLADEAVPASDIGRPDEHHVLRLQREVLGQREGRR